MFKEIDPSYLLGTIINPLSLYFICNHYIATEIDPESDDYVDYKYNINIPYGTNNLLKNKNYDSIKNYDIILCQVNLFDFFYDKVLPLLGDKKIVLLTSQWDYPCLVKSEKTDALLKCPNILLWVSQNPIYNNVDKYMGFPYGIHMKDLSLYYSFLAGFYENCKSTDDELNKILTSKNSNIKHMNLTVKDWYDINHIRKKYDILGVNSPKRLGYITYLQEIGRSRYLISPEGDRPDCYRNYECIGLGCIPITNLESNKFNAIFETNVLYYTPEKIIDSINTRNIDTSYVVPNTRLILYQYWRDKIVERLKQIKL